MNSEKYYTPQELIDRFPQTLDFEWTVSIITELFDAGLLEGGFEGMQLLIEEASFLRLLMYRFIKSPICKN